MRTKRFATGHACSATPPSMYMVLVSEEVFFREIITIDKLSAEKLKIIPTSKRRHWF